MTHASVAGSAPSTDRGRDPALSAPVLERRTNLGAAGRALSLYALPHAEATGITRRRATLRFVATLVVADLTAVGAVIVLDPTLAVPATVVAVVAVALWRSFGLYERRFTLSVLDDLPRLLLGLCVGLGLAACLGAWVDLSGLTLLAAATALGLPAGRAIAYRSELRLRRSGRIDQRRVAILGYGPVATGLARRFRERSELGGAFAGFVTASARPEDGAAGSVEALNAAAEALRLTDVVITVVDLTPELLADVRRICDAHGIDVYIVSGFHMTRWSAATLLDHVWGIPVDLVRSPRYDTGARSAKRAIDVVLAGMALVVSAPLLLAVAVAVRWEGGPGVIFRQQRVGQGGRVFTVYKFRSLEPDASTEGEATWSVADDPRIGPVGRFIRKTSIDELPQLVNVVKGDMSLVGPRPERPRFVDRYAASVPHYAERHRVPVGMTGHAAVHGLRGDTSIPDRAVFDHVYIEQWSLWLDLKIIVRTIGEVLRGRGA